MTVTRHQKADLAPSLLGSAQIARVHTAHDQYFQCYCVTGTYSWTPRETRSTRSASPNHETWNGWEAASALINSDEE